MVSILFFSEGYRREEVGRKKEEKLESERRIAAMRNWFSLAVLEKSKGEENNEMI